MYKTTATKSIILYGAQHGPNSPPEEALCRRNAKETEKTSLQQATWLTNVILVLA